MKYIEQIKSIVLFLLVFLSLGLTFTIWNFTPKTLDAIDDPAPSLESAIVETKKIEQVVRPLKILIHGEESVNGTVNKDQIDSFLKSMNQWDISDLTLLSDEATVNEMKDIMHDPARAVIYYPGAVPFPVFDAMMNVSDTNVPEATFNRVVVNWESSSNGALAVYFVNSDSGRIYEGTVQLSDFGNFEESFIVPAEEYPLYITDESIGTLPIYVPEEPVDTSSYVYLYEETPMEVYADRLFDGTVDSLPDGGYTDKAGAFLERSEAVKGFEFVQSKAETTDPAIPSELVFNTTKYINDHGGWTNDYYYFGMEPINQEIDYRLFINNLPVFGSTVSTAIEMQWGTAEGEEDVFRYDRPIYILEPTGRTVTKDQASGSAVLAALSRLSEEERAQVKEIMPGYELTRNSNEPDRLMIVEPNWYFKLNNTWLKLTTEVLGGGPFGLE
ncbi:two-component system activity regulator YycH [Planomicrobium sp. Y74]|uniref:YycH family regulatory protein n=1 Tax=Planomicrobium sp. Y74 TaxID=2478977 RepID=UPI000EF47A4A|nr:two-component system activity regulator YycH [Planomicrobium sp. Y74]RLQ89683.1 transcriptional regulator [Planomicrobium sp. Y74]